jgi:HEAT repeat protein
MIREFAKSKTPELLYEVYKTNASEYVRMYCVEGFSAQTQVPQIRRAMKATVPVQKTNDMMMFGDEPKEIQVIEKPSCLIRRAAVAKSSENPDAFGVSDYIASIAHGDYQSRNLNSDIVDILAKKGDNAAIEPLIEMFEYDYSRHEAAIVKAVIAIDPNSIYHALEHQNQTIRENAWWALNSSGIDFPLEKDYLVKHLNDSRLVYTVIRLLAQNYPESLTGFLDHENPQVRKRTIELLVENPDKYLEKGGPSLKELLLLHVQDPDAGCRQAILSALGGFRSDKEVYNVFLDALKDTGSSCRTMAIRYLKDSEETLSILDTLLTRETNSHVRVSAIHYISQSKEPSKYKVLIKYTHDDSPEVRRIIVQSLDKWEDRQVIELLKAGLNDTDSQVQYYAINSIARRDIEVLSEIIPRLNPKLRRTAYHSLREFKTDKAIHLLIKGTQDDDADVREAALWSLAKQKDSYELDDPIVVAVRKCLQDDNPPVRVFAMNFLYGIGDQSLDQVAAYLYDSKEDMKINATGILATSKGPKAVKYLMDALAQEEDKEVLVEMVLALERITGNLLTKDEWIQWWNENEKAYLETKD